MSLFANSCVVPKNKQKNVSQSSVEHKRRQLVISRPQNETGWRLRLSFCLTFPSVFQTDINLVF